jgi:2-keto-4-pentenoate hydratase/2-oxohepta-3-ene-1,7-dioic acid hydratase in catechol pathway
MPKFVRYQTDDGISYGILEGSTVRQIQGGLFGGHAETGATDDLASVKLLAPVVPGKILAVGLNYKSHLGGRPQPQHPEMFYKPVTALQNPGDPIVLPRDSTDVHWQHGQGKDLQWWRAKGCDTFAPLGPAVVTDLDYGKLLLTTRLNGEVVQQQYTSDLIFDAAAIVSWVSGWVTLEPGDLIYTGTPGSTRKLSPGDTVEVEIEGIGVLRNPVE